MECLKEQDVDTVFGFPGGTVIALYNALYDYPEINHVLTCHEQHAAHAADGYARATGKPGVVFATSGPGATNLVTGIATAYICLLYTSLGLVNDVLDMSKIESGVVSLQESNCCLLNTSRCV